MKANQSLTGATLKSFRLGGLPVMHPKSTVWLERSSRIETGVSLRDALFASLGDTWTGWVVAPEAGPGQIVLASAAHQHSGQGAGQTAGQGSTGQSSGQNNATPGANGKRVAEGGPESEAR